MKFNFFNKIKKGEYGYIKYRRKCEIITALLLLLLCVAVYLLGYFSTGSNQNLLTFVAVLGVLPMAKVAVSAVLFCKAKGVSEESYDAISASGVLPDYWELFFTQYKKNFQISALTYKKGNLVGFSEDSSIDVEECEKHLKTVCENCDHKNVTVKIFCDRNKFIARIKELNELTEDTERLDFLRENILNVSI